MSWRLRDEKHINVNTHALPLQRDCGGCKMRKFYHLKC